MWFFVCELDFVEGLNLANIYMYVYVCSCTNTHTHTHTHTHTERERERERDIDLAQLKRIAHLCPEIPAIDDLSLLPLYVSHIRSHAHPCRRTCVCVCARTHTQERCRHAHGQVLKFTGQ